MTVEKPKVTIVGLGLIGTSIGLALRQSQAAALVVGHDKDSAVSARAKKLEAVDKTDWMLIPACENADLVILALPVGAIEETLQVIGPCLRPGCVVMDTASLKVPVLQWAAASLPPEVHFVGGDPVLGQPAPGQEGISTPRADLFQKALFCVVPAEGTTSEAIKLATDLIAILGARPMFYDALEHDGLMAGVEGLPSLLAWALLETVAGQPSWREARKLAGPSFEGSTRTACADPAALGQLLWLNRDNLVRWLDTLAVALDSIRSMLAQGHPEPLVKPLEKALQQRSEWLQLRAAGLWDEIPRQEVPRQSMLQPLLGGLAGRKPKRKP